MFTKHLVPVILSTRAIYSITGFPTATLNSLTQP